MGHGTRDMGRWGEGESLGGGFMEPFESCVGGYVVVVATGSGVSFAGSPSPSPSSSISLFLSLSPSPSPSLPIVSIRRLPSRSAMCGEIGGRAKRGRERPSLAD